MMLRISVFLLSYLAASVDGQTGEGIVQPDPNLPCTVCWGQETPSTSPDFVWFSAETDMTCESIIADVEAANTTQGTDTCKNSQLASFQLGCCPSPPYEYCDVCPDGGQIARSNDIPFGSTTQYTCAENLYREASYNAIQEPGTCDDTIIRRGAFYCDCPNVEQQCTLCPDGSSPTNPERGDAWVTGSNCEGLEFLFSIYTAEECDGLRNNFGVDFAHFCKCPDYEKDEEIEEECFICSGGLANPSFTYTDPNDNFQRTCSQAADFAKSITRQNTCDTYMQQVLARGCRCNDGGPVFRNPNSSGAEHLTTIFSTGAMIAFVVKGVFA